VKTTIASVLEYGEQVVTLISRPIVARAQPFLQRRERRPYDPELASLMGGSFVEPCSDDDMCSVDDDCVCRECDDGLFCSDPEDYEEDGECRMFDEGCVCSDCAELTDANSSKSIDFFGERQDELSLWDGTTIAHDA